MTGWKQEILNRIGLPRVSEELFNKAWDESADIREALTQTKLRAADKQFQRKIIDISTSEGLLNVRPLVPPPMSPEEWRKLYDRFHNCAWKFFLDHPSDTSTEQEVREYIENYNPWAANAVLYGYDPYKFVSPELGGALRSKAGWREAIAYLDKYTGFIMSPSQDVDAFRGPYQVFSNFYPAPVMFAGAMYPTVENAFQAAKCTQVADRSMFCGCPPAEAKKLGRRCKLRSDWEWVKDDIMFRLLLQKFAEGSDNLRLLLSTGDGLITEGNTWHDNYWGICSCPRCGGSGKNMMGKLLTTIREFYKAKECAVEDRFAVILPERFGPYLQESDYLCSLLHKQYRPTGILIKCSGPKTLYHHSTNPGAVLSEGFKLSGDEFHTFGGDVVYAYPDPTHAPNIVVQVKKYMQSYAVEDKEDCDQGECIFFPEDVISVERYPNK